MALVFPAPEWERLSDVQREWGVKREQILQFAASGALRLYALVNYPCAPPMFYTGNHSGWRHKTWSPTNPVVVSAEDVAELIHRQQIEFKEWTTKDGAMWRNDFPRHGAGLVVCTHDLVVYREDKKRFEAAHSNPDEGSDPKSHEEEEISESERNKLLKHIGCLALLLAEKSNRYKRGDKPSANAIAEDIQGILESLPDVPIHGSRVASLRESISKGIAALAKP